MKVKKSVMVLIAMFFSFQVLAEEVTVASLLSDGYEVKAMTKSNYNSLVILQKNDKAYICLINDIAATTKTCEILR
jgi:hypothetical protein